MAFKGIFFCIELSKIQGDYFTTIWEIYETIWEIYRCKGKRVRLISIHIGQFDRGGSTISQKTNLISTWFLFSIRQSRVISAGLYIKKRNIFIRNTSMFIPKSEFSKIDINNPGNIANYIYNITLQQIPSAGTNMMSQTFHQIFIYCV